MKPKPFFSAYKDEFDNDFNEVDNPKPDFRIREERDIDEQGLFLTTRIFQPQNLNNNIVNLFNMDFGTVDNTPFNRFEGAVPSKNYKDLKEFDRMEEEETYRRSTIKSAA